MRINIHVLLVLLLFGLGALYYIGARTSPIIVFVYSVCIISFLVSIYLTKWVLSKDEGPPEMVQVAVIVGSLIQSSQVIQETDLPQGSLYNRLHPLEVLALLVEEVYLTLVLL